MKLIKATLIVIGALLVALVLVVSLIEPPAHMPAARSSKSIFDMSQAERKAASDARKLTNATPEDRARWKCSSMIEAAVWAPGTYEPMRRSQWPVYVREGTYVVQATYAAKNRFGTLVRESRSCRVRL